MPGTADLTRADFEAWAAGAVTLTDLAVRVGVTKQAVAKVFKSRGWSRVAGTDQPTPSSPPVPTVSGTGRVRVDTDLDEGTRQRIAATVRGTLVQDGLELVSEIRRYRQAHTGKIGPKALRDLAAAQAAASNLVLAGLSEPPSSQKAELPKIVVKGMTAEEEAQLRARVQRRAEAGLDYDGDDHDGEHGEAVPASPEALEAAPPSPAVPDASTPRLRLHAPLPMQREDFIGWLDHAGKTVGRRYLRQLAEALGAKVGLADDVPRLTAAILDRTQGRADRLLAFSIEPGA